MKVNSLVILTLPTQMVSYHDIVLGQVTFPPSKWLQDNVLIGQGCDVINFSVSRLTLLGIKRDNLLSQRGCSHLITMDSFIKCIPFVILSQSKTLLTVI